MEVPQGTCFLRPRRKQQIDRTRTISEIHTPIFYNRNHERKYLMFEGAFPPWVIVPLLVTNSLRSS